MRRSAFMNVPSCSNDEQAGRNTVPKARADSVRNRSWTISSSSAPRALAVSSARAFVR
jgi:hypothetical protein